MGENIKMYNIPAIAMGTSYTLRSKSAMGSFSG
jgi:hypothetical protein